MSCNKDIKILGLLGLSVLLSAGAAASERYNNNFHEGVEGSEAIVDLSTLRFRVHLPYGGIENRVIAEIPIGRNLIGNNLDPDVVNSRLGRLNQHVLPAVEGAFELTKGVLREFHDCPEKQMVVIRFTKGLVERLLAGNEYTEEEVRAELADFNDHQTQDSKLSHEELKRVEDTFTSRAVDLDEDLRITGFLRAMSDALENYHNDDAPRTFGSAA